MGKRPSGGYIQRADPGSDSDVAAVRDPLRPSPAEPNNEKECRSKRVEVRKRVNGEPAVATWSGISNEFGHKSVGKLMQGHSNDGRRGCTAEDNEECSRGSIIEIEVVKDHQAVPGIRRRPPLWLTWHPSLRKLIDILSRFPPAMDTETGLCVDSITTPWPSH